MSTRKILYLLLFVFGIGMIYGCEPQVKEGCTDELSYTFDSEAEVDDGSCEYYYGGKNYGQLDIGSVQDLDNEYDIYFDGEYIGRSTKYFPNGFECGDPNAIGKVIPSGRHVVRAVGNGGTEIREGVVDLDPQECKVELIEYLQVQNNSGGGPGDGDNGGDEEPTTGSLVIWTDEDHGCGNLKVYVNNSYKGDVTGYYYSGAPSCGADYTVTLTNLPPGSYEVYAECEDGSGNWSGESINVYAGQCSTYLLD